MKCAKKINNIKIININEIDLNNSFFHFTCRENLENITREGLKSDIGDASKIKSEKEARVYMAKGGKGLIGIKNSFIHEMKKLRICEIPQGYRKYFDFENFSSEEQLQENEVYSAMEKRFKDEIYFKVDAIEGEDYIIEDFYPEELVNSFRTSNDYKDVKGKAGHDIETKKLWLLTTDKGDTAFDVVQYLYERLLENARKSGKQDVVREANSDLDGMFEYIKQKEISTQDIGKATIGIETEKKDIAQKQVQQDLQKMQEIEKNK